MRFIPFLALAMGLATATAASAQTLRIGLQEDPDLLDPHKARTFVGRIVFTSLCDKLVDITPELKFKAQLATSWAWSDDGRTLTMKLQDGVVFHDGEKFDAKAVKANIERAKSLPDSLRKSELASVDSVEAADPLTVRFHLKRPDATLLAQLSDRSGMMLAPEAMAKPDFGRKPVCSGPYKFVERVQNDRIVLEKFARYRDATAYPVDRVVFQPIPDTTVRLANLRAGDLDLIERVAATDVKSIKSDANLNFASVVGLAYQGITVNLANGPKAKNAMGQDPRVRQAFELAIDRNIINQVVFEGYYPPTVQPFPPASFYFNKSKTIPPRDVEKAKALLKEAGQPNPAFEMLFANNNVQQQVAELIQAMTAEAGFKVTLRATEFAAMLSAAQAGNFQAEAVGWSGRVDPDGNLHQFVTCGAGLNDGKYCNKEVDKLLNQARETTDEAARKKLYDQAEAILDRDLPIIYLYNQPWQYALAKKVKGFEPYPDGMIRLKGVSVGS